MKTYEQLNIYEATFEEVYEAVKNQYKNREHRNYNYELVTVGEWKEINKNIKDDLKEMDVKFKDAFYNPNNMRVYIKQKFWTETNKFFEMFTEEEQAEEIERFGSRKAARKHWNEEEVNSSLAYAIATGEDYHYTEADYFTVGAW